MWIICHPQNSVINYPQKKNAQSSCYSWLEYMYMYLLGKWSTNNILKYSHNRDLEYNLFNQNNDAKL